ncbi:hypothetical protein JCM10550A_09840 [Methanogenium cariaci]|jgi:aldehyde:ferredoxin oxidoreductase
MSTTTGTEIRAAKFLKIGGRIWDIQKLFILTVGYTKADDTLPDGAPKGRIWERQPLLDEYYAEREWDNEGVPTPQKLLELGLAARGIMHAYI